MELPKDLTDDIKLYCEANKITDLDEFIIGLVKQGLTVVKYGATPITREKVVEKFVDKIVEVPVDRIVEKIVEVQIPMIDTDMSKDLQKYIDIVNKSNIELLKSTDENKKLKKELETEKQKTKRDIYGER
jgi:hypothetical protein